MIVGHNGSGKTTIVECLKYAATGDLPPNTKGGGFVHDPYMAGVDTVKAQVRLRFRNTSGTRMNCVRNLQVSKKKGGGLTMKTLEGVLGVDDDTVDAHARSSLSTRCAELDMEMASLLGVPRAILEHVLFCHQEEANWPLAEPAVLKKRFDEIFEVARYTKALESIRALRKQRAQDARVDDADLRALEQEKERAQSVRNKIQSLQNAIQEKVDERDKVDEALQRMTSSNQALYDDATRFRDVVNRAEVLEEKLALCNEHKHELLSRMTRLDATEAELNEQLATYPAQLESEQARLEHAKQNQDAFAREKETCSREHEKALRRHAEADAAEKAWAKLMSECANELQELGGKKGGLDVAEALHAELHAQLETAQRQATASADEHATRCASAQSELSRLEQENRDAHVRLEQTQASLHRLREKIAACGAEANHERSEAASELASARQALATLRASELPDLSAAQAQQAALEAERDAAVKAFMDAPHDTHNLSERMSRWQSVCEEVLGSVPSDYDQELREATEAAERSRKEARRAADAAVECHTTHAMLTELEAESHDEVQSLSQDLTSLLSDFDSVEQGLQTVRDEMHVVRESMGILEYAAAFFERIQHHAHERHVCLACQQAMPASKLPALDEHIATLRERSAAPNKLERLGQDLTTWERLESRLYMAKAVHAQLSKWKDRHSTLVHKSRRAKEASIAATEAKSRAEAEHDARAAHVEKLRIVQPMKVLLDEAKAHSDGSHAMPTRDIHAMREQIDALRSQVSAFQEAHDSHRARVRAAESHVHTLEMRVAADEQAAAQKQAAKLRLEEYKAEEQELEQGQSALERKLAALRSPLDAAQQAFDAAKDARLAEEQACNTHIRDLERRADRAANIIRRLHGAKAPMSLAECTTALETAADALRAAATRADAAAHDAYTLEAALRDARTRASNLRDNLRLREVVKEAERVETELHSLDLEGALARAEQASQAYDAARKREHDMSGRAAHIRGEIHGLEAELARREAELRDDYAGVDARYMKQLVHIKVAGMANHDLDTYCGAFQQAILQYHGIKMEEVNQTLDYLWRKTYQGTDIDTILIRADAEGTRTTAHGLRSYQYRVCMRKDGVELDMRGRCSAGQKVLACILIRLALADSFGEQCGCIALDEPTTNLDSENVQALAASLVDVLAERRNQRNFQLIVITHDEHFLTQLSHSDALEEYWRVTRDDQLNSVIERDVVHR